MDVFDKYKKYILGGVSVFAVGVIMYVVGLLSQFRLNQIAYEEAGGAMAGATLELPSLDLITCYKAAFTGVGLLIFILLLIVAAGAFTILKMYDRFNGGEKDERGFKVSEDGTYGTAKWMSQKEMKDVFEVAPVGSAKGTILGEYKGNVVCMPEDTKLNRHIMIFGASGTMKSRAIIRNSIFQSIRRGESSVITDPKGELYNDTAELYRKNGYDVRVFNLVDPDHGDGWNCMSDLNGDSLLATVLTSVIIGNTSSGKGDPFWEKAEMNLLKALILYVDQSETFPPEKRNLATVYSMLTDKKAKELESTFECLAADHPARAPYNIFAQSEEKVKQSVILGLGTRLQILQAEKVKNLVRKSDIDLTLPARKKCAYFLILSDQDATMAFLSSLFFSCLFLKLTRYADMQPNKKCPIPVNLILDEFNNIGRIGGAADGSDFTRTLSVIRSRDIRVMIAVQSLGQLQNRYQGTLWAEITGNCDIQLMLGCTDDVTAKYISDRSGEMSIEVESVAVEKRTVAIMQLIPNYRESHGEGKRKLLTPDEVLRLTKDELLVITRGQNMLRLKKFDFTKHPMSKQMVPCSLYDYTRGSGPVGDNSKPSDRNCEDAYLDLLTGKQTAKTEKTDVALPQSFAPQGFVPRVDFQSGEVLSDLDDPDELFRTENDADPGEEDYTEYDEETGITTDENGEVVSINTEAAGTLAQLRKPVDDSKKDKDKLLHIPYDQLF